MRLSAVDPKCLSRQPLGPWLRILSFPPISLLAGVRDITTCLGWEALEA